MLDIERIDHVGIRIRDKNRSVEFYRGFGFELLMDAGFDRGHPVILQHPSGVVLNLLGPTTHADAPNVLMDIDEKHPGITHIALRVRSLDDARKFLDENGIAVTGSFEVGDLRALFFRDPDGSVIELDEYPGDEPKTRLDAESNLAGYGAHP